jgi:hydrogenase-4 component F
MKYQTRDLGKVKGLLQATPFTGLLMMVGALALVGSPPFNIFISKFGIISSGIASGFVWLMVACVMFLAVVFASFLRVISSSVFGELPDSVAKGEFKASILAPVAALMIMVLILGFYLPPQVGVLLNQATEEVLVNQSVAGVQGFFLGLDMAKLPVGLLQVGQYLAP